MLEAILEFLGELLFECLLESLFNACTCGLWSGRDAGFDSKPRRKGVA